MKSLAVRFCLDFFAEACNLMDAGDPGGRTMWGQTMTLADKLEAEGHRFLLPILPAGQSAVERLPTIAPTPGEVDEVDEVENRRGR